MCTPIKIHYLNIQYRFLKEKCFLESWLTRWDATSQEASSNPGYYIEFRINTIENVMNPTIGLIVLLMSFLLDDFDIK